MKNIIIYKTIHNDYILTTDGTIEIQTAGVSLITPNPYGNNNKYVIKNFSSGVCAVVSDPYYTDTSIVQYLNSYDSITIQSDGVNKYIIE